jgi:hypothetical protein
MNDTSATYNPGTERLIEIEVNNALRKHGVAVSSPVKENVRQRVRLVWGHSDAAVCVVDDNGALRTIPDYLNELESDPKYGAYFTRQRLPQISVNDTTRMREDFAKIARGEIQVVDDPDV